MDNIKDKKYYIQKVLDNLYQIEKNMKDITLDTFVHDIVLQSAVSFWYVQAYEYVKKLVLDDFDDETKTIIMKLRGFRNLIVHEYGKVDVISVYDTSIKNVPTFIARLEKEIK